MRIIILALLLSGCAAQEAYYDPKPKTELPDLPTIAGAGTVTKIPNKKLSDEEKDLIILHMQRNEKLNAEGYNARGRAYEAIRRTYGGQ